MKIKTISRSLDSSGREANTEVQKMRKNADPKLHPFEKAREYTRALNATKIERMMAKPFLGALEGHSDGVYCSATSPTSLVSYVSGAADGEVIVWDLAARKKLWSVYAHAGFVKSLAVSHDGEFFFSCGSDKVVRQWRMAPTDDLAAGLDDGEDDEGEDVVASASMAAAGHTMAGAKRVRHGGAGGEDEGSGSGSASGGRSWVRGAGAGGVADAGSNVQALSQWTGKHGFTYIDHHWRSRTFATASVGIHVWDYNRSEPTHVYEWGGDTVSTVRWNPAEHGLLASTGNDRSIVLYDIRTDSALRKLVMSMNSNAMAWNPREPFNFTVANDDHCAYTFDMRKLDSALMVHKDHVGAVMDISYSPTGKEFVTGSYDKTVRIWAADAGRSREVYHAKRMQRVFTVKFTGDAKYILSGSDDTNIRLWKADASAKLGRLAPKEREHMDYAGALKKRFGHMPEIKKIAAQRNLPKYLLKAKKARDTEEAKERRKVSNIRAHSAADSKEGIPLPARKRRIVGEMK